LHRLADDTHGNQGKWADLSKTHLENADLRDTCLNFANFEGAYLSNAHFNNARLFGANLNATVDGADFSGASLVQVEFNEADLFNANFSDATYEPSKIPPVERIAEVRGLDRLRFRFEQNRIDLTGLRKSLLTAGYERQARQVNASIRRHDERWLEKILFDWTCDWGSDWRHPLVLLGWLCFVWAPAMYWVGMHLGGEGGIYRIEWSELVPTKAAKEVVTRVDTKVRWIGGGSVCGSAQ
jgi:hypothetical protein